nr:MAG TPA: hypothetical protein [Caudoviricetes sp.]
MSLSYLYINVILSGGANIPSFNSRKLWLCEVKWNKLENG